MNPRTLEQLQAALDAVQSELSPRVSVLADRSTNGELTDDERREYAEIVRLNDTLSLVRLRAGALRSVRAAS